jgi:hypothetical protein
MPTRGSHPNARSAASAGICRQRAASGSISSAWTSDATRDCLEGARTSAQIQRANHNAPPDALARAQRVPGLLPKQEAREFGRGQVVHSGEANGGYEEGVQVVGEVEREDCGHGRVWSVSVHSPIRTGNLRKSSFIPAPARIQQSTSWQSHCKALQTRAFNTSSTHSGVRPHASTRPFLRTIQRRPLRAIPRHTLNRGRART